MNKTGKYCQSRSNLLSVYFTADYPYLGSTKHLIRLLEEAGADLIEVGIPFSDPIADGPVIQESSKIAIQNGFSLAGMFADIKAVRSQTKIPIVLMGYFNTVLAFGVELFLTYCQELNIDTLILPDMPPEIFENQYQELFERYGVAPVFLVTPQTKLERMTKMDQLSRAFIYAVSNNSTTGNRLTSIESNEDYFERIAHYNFSVPVLIGFGISEKAHFDRACQYAQGAIVGSAFIQELNPTKDLECTVHQFVRKFKKTQL